MRQVVLQQATPIKFHRQKSTMLPAHGTGSKREASNDENYRKEETVLGMTMSVLANTIGGAILLLAMFNLPIILAVIWDM